MARINLNPLSVTIFLLLVSVTSVYGQRLVEQNKLWTYYVFLGNTGGDPGTDHPLGVTLAYSYGGPEVVNDQTYYRLRSGDNFNYDSSWDSTDFLMREDSLGRVYMKENDLPEVMIYDFSLEINEVFYNPVYSCSQTLISKDSIALNSGSLWEQFSFDSGATWIKGIGSTASVLPSCYGPGGLVCFQIDDELDYTGELFYETGECFFFPVNVSETTTTSISVFPNPVQHSFSIRSEEEPLNGLLVITNAMGQKIYQKTLKHTSLEEVDLSTYPAGVYYLNFGKMKQKLVKIY